MTARDFCVGMRRLAKRLGRATGSEGPRPTLESTAGPSATLTHDEEALFAIRVNAARSRLPRWLLDAFARFRRH